MNKFLAIDTSSRHLTVYLRDGERRFLHNLADCAMRHSEVLMDEIDRTFGEAGLTPRDLDGFIVVTGPGSFTGIRIGIATAKGFSVATNKPLFGVTAFDAVAYNVEKADFCVVIDAGRGQYYVCEYSGGVAGEPRYTDGGGLSELPRYGFEELPVAGYHRLDIAECFAHAADGLEFGPQQRVQALYVRKSQAEENLKK